MQTNHANGHLLFLSIKPLLRNELQCLAAKPSEIPGEHLVVVLITLIIDHVVESQLVHALVGGDDAQPVTKLLFLEELLCAVTHRLARGRSTIFLRAPTYRYLR